MIEALLVAVRDTLRTALLANSPGADAAKMKMYVDITPGDSWPVRVGEWFVNVDEESVQANADGDRDYLEEEYTVSVTITKKTGVFAKDNSSSIYLENLRGLSALERKVITAVHGINAVRVAANVAAGGAPSSGSGDAFVGVLCFAGRGKSFPAFNPAEESESPTPFMRRKLTFKGGLRIQALDVMK